MSRDEEYDYLFKGKKKVAMQVIKGFYYSRLDW